MNALEINNLTKSYKDFTLGDLCLTIPEGSITGFIGENGAGKSTTIKLILGAIKRDGGDISILGNNSYDDSIKEDIGVVLDDVGFPGCLTAVQVGNIMRNAYKNWSDDLYTDYLRKLGIPDKKPFSDFSRGTRMKLGFAVCMSHSPRLLLLDEATGGLDPVVRDEVTTIIKDFASDGKHSVLISSHIVSDLEKICDRIAFIHQGQLLMCKSKEEIAEEYSGMGLEDLFLKMVKGEMQ